MGRHRVFAVYIRQPVFFFRLFHSFLSVPGGQPAGRQGCREVFSSSTWVRETDGACQTVVCGFIQIYDGRKWGWMWTGRVGEERRRREAGGPAFGFILKHWKPLDGGGGFPAQWCCCLNWLCFISARCSVYYCFVVYRGRRPCLHIELHYIPPRTQSCLSDCLIGICWDFANTKASCFISHQFGFAGLATNINNTRLLTLPPFVMSFKSLKIMNNIKTIARIW